MKQSALQYTNIIHMHSHRQWVGGMSFINLKKTIESSKANNNFINISVQNTLLESLCGSYREEPKDQAENIRIWKWTEEEIIVMFRIAYYSITACFQYALNIPTWFLYNMQNKLDGRPWNIHNDVTRWQQQNVSHTLITQYVVHVHCALWSKTILNIAVILKLERSSTCHSHKSTALHPAHIKQLFSLCEQTQKIYQITDIQKH